MEHLGETDQRTTQELARRVRGGPAERLGDLFARIAEFETEDDRLSMILGELGEPALVALHRLTANRLVEGGRPFVTNLILQGLAFGSPVGAPDLVPDLVEKDLPQVAQERPFASRLELSQASQRSHEGVLHQVVGVGDVAGPGGETAVGPAAEEGEVALQEPFAGAEIPASNPGEQGRCGFGSG